jgi:hypothetical protein
MKLLTIGDSFTCGEELVDVSKSWPNLLADRLDYELTNLALPSKGNSYMVRTCIEHAGDYDLTIIAWSHFARIEFADEWGVFDIWPGSNSKVFSHIDVKHRQELVKYITKFYSDEYLYNQYLINVIAAQNYLRNKSYIFLDAFGNNAGRSIGNQQLHEQIDSGHYLGWPNNTMMEWTYNCPQGPNGHFLEQGHRIVADKLYEYIRN